jgi:hypothetical protein
LSAHESYGYELDRYDNWGLPVPNCLTQLRALQTATMMMPPLTPAPIFLHALRLPGKPPKLVRVHAVAGGPQDCWGLACYVETCPDKPGVAPVDLTDVEYFWPDPLDHAATVRMHAGQPDPNDESHFTIELEVDGQRRVLDGRLTTKDQITLTARTGPAPMSRNARSLLRLQVQPRVRIPVMPQPEPASGLQLLFDVHR